MLCGGPSPPCVPGVHLLCVLPPPEGEHGRAAATLTAFSDMLRTVKQLRTDAGTEGQAPAVFPLQRRGHASAEHQGGVEAAQLLAHRGAAAWRKPLRCCDLLSKAYARGGVDVVLALQGLFTLMLKHNL
ncbi:hypothetical protein AB1Y20_014793 [Prymnesium parvum]|uniref:Uncharacterized protein n=1 Tax=Prymnesium parvum TaxID=97485 RepID=A0AB34IED5_PRYPA